MVRPQSIEARGALTQPMVIAEFAVTPVGEGTSERQVVQAAVDAARSTGVELRVGPFGTAIEVESLDQVFEVVRAAHEAAVRAGAERVLLEMRVDDRRDKHESLDELASS
jgi:uncharacterized protein (TIGR00106 family)